MNFDALDLTMLQRFLIEIRERPWDELAKKKMSDWFEENGEQDAADTVRTILELTRLFLKSPSNISVIMLLAFPELDIQLGNINCIQTRRNADVYTRTNGIGIQETELLQGAVRSTPDLRNTQEDGEDD